MNRIPDALSTWRTRTLAPFVHRDFRILRLAIFLRSGSLWLEQVARPVLMLELTDSALLLGAALAAWIGPNSILPRFDLLTMGSCLIAGALVAWTIHRMRWWLWRRRTCDEASAEAWLRGEDISG